MKTSLLSIQPVEGTNEFQVLMLIGDNRQQFTFTVEHPEQKLFTVIGGDMNFCKFFRFNQHISAKVGDVVGQVERGKIIELPVSVGDFYTPEAAMERQRHFRLDFLIKRPTPEEIIAFKVSHQAQAQLKVLL